MSLLQAAFDTGFLQNLLEDVDAFVRQCEQHALERYVSTTLSLGTPSCLWVLFKRGMSQPILFPVVLQCAHFLDNGNTYQRVMLGEIQDLLVGVNTMKKKKSVIKAKSSLYPAAFVGESSSG